MFFGFGKKRGRENGTEEEKEAKRRKKTSPVALLGDVQAEILYLEERCAAEQTAKQNQYDSKKKPLLVKRALGLREIPQFWRTVIGVVHKIAGCEPFATKDELGLLSYLQEIFVEQNVDENGSYLMRFEFAKNNPYVSTGLTLLWRCSTPSTTSRGASFIECE